jgi:hypothetical protein
VDDRPVEQFRSPRHAGGVHRARWRGVWRSADFSTAAPTWTPP